MTRTEIFGLSELRWTGLGQFQFDDYKLLFSGHETCKRNGVAVICNKKTARSVLGYNLVNDRLISVRLKGHPVNTTIIQIYAPTSPADEENVEEFYGKLEELVEQVPKGDALIIM